MRAESAVEKLPRTIFVWASLLLAFTAFGVLVGPIVLLLGALGLDPDRRVSARIARAAFRAYIVWGTVIGKARVRGRVPRRGPFVVVSNHESGFDTFLTIGLAPAPARIISKAGNWKVPIVGLAAWASAALFLRDERGLESGGLGPLDEARSLLSRGVSVVFFVEGSRSRGRGVRRFRRGAFELAAAANVPVLPVVIVGSGEFMPPGVGLLGPLRVTMEVLPPRRVLGDVDEFRKSLRAEIAARHAAILAEPHHAPTRSERSIVPIAEPALDS